MHNEMTLSVKSKNNVSRYLFLGLIGTALIFILAAYFGAAYSGILWLVALGFITAAIYVYNGHVAAEYYYEIRNDGGRESFVVNMRVGKTSRTLARLDLWSIAEVRRMTGKEYRAYKCEKKIIKYPYFPTLFPESVYLVSIRSEYENADIFIEATEEFAQALMQMQN